MRKRILELMPVLACLTLVLATAGPAFATFPGRNGLIAFQVQTDAGIQIYTVASERPQSSADHARERRRRQAGLVTGRPADRLRD